MIAGTGIDIIEVERVKNKLERSERFREKVFSPGEVAFCEQRANKYEHYAARFAAKEAFVKATGLGLLAGHDLCDIEVTTDVNGKPGIALRGSFAARWKERGWSQIHVSLSHIAQAACAVVIIEK